MGMKSIRRGLLLGAALLVAAAPALAQQNGTARLGLKLSGDQPIQIESDKLEVNETEAKATFSGNVSVVQGATLLKAGRMIVFYAKQEGGAKGATPGNSAIERLEVDDKVYLKSESQEATGDKGTFDMKSEVLTLSGTRVVLTEGPNVLTGCKLTVLMKTGEAQFEPCGGGRVTTVLTPGSQSN